MDNIQNAIRSATGLFIVLPGIAVIATGIRIPEHLTALFGGALAATGVIAILLLKMFEPSAETTTGVRLMSRAHVLVLTIVSLLLFLGSLYTYTIAYNHAVEQVHYHDRVKEVYLPLWPTGELAQGISHYQGRRNFVLSGAGVDGIDNYLADQSVQLALTDLVLLILYLVGLLSLVCAVIFAAFGINVRSSGRSPDDAVSDAEGSTLD